MQVLTQIIEKDLMAVIAVWLNTPRQGAVAVVVAPAARCIFIAKQCSTLK